MPAQYKLIEARKHPQKKECSHHNSQKLVDLYNDPNWSMQVIDIDKIQFVCDTCESIRVYKLLSEKTLLRTSS